MGVNAEVSTDFEQMVEWKDGIVDQLTGGVEQLCRANGVELVEGIATFQDETSVTVESDSGPDVIHFENAIIATGSRPIQLPGFEFSAEPILDSQAALAAQDVPDRLLVVGGGYIGMELSTVYAKLGSQVTVVEMLDSILPTYPEDLSDVVHTRAESLGIEFEFGEAAQDWTEDGDGIVVTTETEDGSVYEYATDEVLVAVGREPVTDGLGLENTTLQTDERGFIGSDKHGQTEVPNIYAVGDVAGEPLLAHEASQQGIAAVQKIAGEPLEVDNWIVPAAVFTDPEIGTVGLSEAEAKEIGFDPVVGKMPFSASGRAMTTGHTEGFVRVIAASDGALLGAEIVGPEASELIAELSFAIRQRATLSDIAETIHVHPTLSEAVKEAAENALGKAIHTTN
jgi:dihydrolipoamide dehydrogenase